MSKTLSLICVVCLVGGCATLIPRNRRFREIDGYVASGRYEEALSVIEEDPLGLYGDTEMVLYYLDAGMLQHFAGNYSKSNEMLLQAELAIEELFTKNVSRAVASLLVNDNIMEYPGEDYEDAYINVFKALNYLFLGRPDSSFVEIRRIDEKLSVLEDKYAHLASNMNTSGDKLVDFSPGDSRFYNSALGRYMSLVMYREDGQYDDATIDLRKIEEAYATQKTVYDFEMPDIVSVPASGGMPRIAIISFTGKCPEKRANTLRIRTERNTLIIAGTTDRYGSVDTDAHIIRWPGIQEGYHFKFQLPYMVPRESSVAAVRVSVDGGRSLPLHKLESIENVAFETYRVKEPIIYLKGITRTVVKGLLAEQAKREINRRVRDPFWAFAGTIAADVAADASEMADLRLARYLPKEAHMVEIPVTEGTHSIRVEYYASSGDLLYTHDMGEVEVAAGHPNLFESFYLD